MVPSNFHGCTRSTFKRGWWAQFSVVFHADWPESNRDKRSGWLRGEPTAVRPLGMLQAAWPGRGSGSRWWRFRFRGFARVRTPAQAPARVPLKHRQDRQEARAERLPHPMTAAAARFTPPQAPWLERGLDGTV